MIWPQQATTVRVNVQSKVTIIHLVFHWYINWKITRSVMPSGWRVSDWPSFSLHSLNLVLVHHQWSFTETPKHEVYLVQRIHTYVLLLYFESVSQEMWVISCKDEFLFGKHSFPDQFSCTAFDLNRNKATHSWTCYQYLTSFAMLSVQNCVF